MNFSAFILKNNLIDPHIRRKDFDNIHKKEIREEIHNYMKIKAISDIHGDLPIIDPCDVLCICGDILPLDIQRNYTKSVAWLAGRFVNWCENIECEKVIIIAGNHDFVFQTMYNDYMEKCETLCWSNHKRQYEDFTELVMSNLNFTGKIVYLQDTSYEYNGVTFYGTPHIPVLSYWAFYKSSEGLKEIFSEIPDKVDVLLTHSPGKFVNDTGVSLQLTNKPEYGSIELTEAVQNKLIRYWFVGHIHSGNHKMEDYIGIKVANVSLKDENYRMVYEPLTIEINN